MPNIFFKEYGTGEPLVLLHGFCETHYVWEEIAKSLQSDFRVVCPDLPGFGKSPLPANDFSLDEIATQLKENLHELGIQKCIVVGHSLGGYITLSIASRYPELVSGFCLFNSTAYPDSPEKTENRNKLITHIKENGVTAFIRTFVPSLFYPPRIEEFESEVKQITEIGLKLSPETVIAYAAAMRDRPDFTDVLKSNSHKALIIAGEEDQNVPKEVSLKLKSLVDEANFYLLPRSAHMSMFEQKKKVVEIISNFKQKLMNFPTGSLN